MVIKEEIIDVLKNTLDPELGIDLWTLGLIYDVAFDEAAQKADITMTYTTPLCPYGPQMTADITKKLEDLGLAKEHLAIKVVFDPPWEPSAEVREMLGV